MEKQRTNAGNAQRGFTLVELAVATLVLLVGVVAVAQLVPAAIESNLTNRYDTTAAVAVQRLRDLMVSQALNQVSLDDPSGQFPCPPGTCLLGIGAPGVDTLEGAPLLAARERGNNVVMQIDFTQAPANGYNFTFTDPNDPTQTRYDVRWAVVTSRRAVGALPDVVVSKRLIIGARSLGTRRPIRVTFSSWITR